MTSTIFGIDFDGTCVEHQFPEMGNDIPFAVHTLKAMTQAGHKLILFTMRSDKEDVNSTDDIIHPQAGKYLTEAVNWFKDREIPLYGIQTNPTQHTWTESPKAYCNIYIDDAALGCPLIDPDNGERPFVDWLAIEGYLVAFGYIDDPYNEDDDDLPF